MSLARWLLIQLDGGKLPGSSGRLFSEAAHAQMWRPVVIQPIAERPPALRPTQPGFSTYALGWDVEDYRGAKIIWHGGAVFGFLTAVVLLPEKHVGFSLQINSEDGEIIRGLMYELLDHYLELPRTDWVAQYRAEKQRKVSEAVAALKARTARSEGGGPSLPISRYAGTYKDPWYGNIGVAVVDGMLRIDFKSTPHMGGVLEHWQYDTFVTRFDDKTIEPAYVTFGLDADGKIDRVTMKAVSPLADFSYDYQDLLFTPVQESR
jgi:hypothetical protein